jgi:hypothetical protein
MDRPMTDAAQCQSQPQQHHRRSHHHHHHHQRAWLPGHGRIERVVVNHNQSRFAVTTDGGFQIRYMKDGQLCYGRGTLLAVVPLSSWG